jgi:hypothetical protein
LCCNRLPHSRRFIHSRRLLHSNGPLHSRRLNRKRLRNHCICWASDYITGEAISMGMCMSAVIASIL